MIIPLANDIDEAELGEAVKNCPDDDMRKKWQTDYNSLMKIKKRGQSSLEIGVVRTLLAHIVGWKSQNDDCAKILMNHIEKHLTSAGKTALMRKEMLDVIDKLLWKNTACQARIPDTFLFRWQKKHVIM